MATKKAVLTISEQIDRARDGRSQTSIVNKMREAGFENITDVTFSRKKKGHDEFTTEELATLSEILGTIITVS
jgi:hypothetical protein